MKIKIFIFFLLLPFIFCSCINLRSCDSDISGRYICYNDEKATNFLDLNKNGTFFHYYKKDSIESFSKGTWEKSSDGDCRIDFSEWKNFNEDGKQYRVFGNGILFINGNYLDISPDGNSSSSFLKQN